MPVGVRESAAVGGGAAGLFLQSTEILGARVASRRNGKMAMVLLPVGKIVHVSDDVVADPVSHKPSILNLWEVVRIPEGASFPYTLGKVCVVALMRDGQGEVRFRADVVQADTAEVIRRSQEYPVSFEIG